MFSLHMSIPSDAIPFLFCNLGYRINRPVGPQGKEVFWPTAIFTVA